MRPAQGTDHFPSRAHSKTMSGSLMLRQRQYIEALENGSPVQIWSVFRGTRSLWAATFLERPGSKGNKVKVRWAGRAKSSFHWVSTSDVRVPDEDLHIPHDVSAHRFKRNGTKEYLTQWGDENHTWETEANESVSGSGILDVYEMQTTAEASEAGAAAPSCALRHEFSQRTGLTKVDMKSVQFCEGLPPDGPPPDDHENDYGLMKEGSNISVWMPIAKGWLHCVVAECLGVKKRRRSSVTKWRRSATPKPSVVARKNPKRRLPSSTGCHDCPRASSSNSREKRHRRGDKKSTKGLQQPSTPTDGGEAQLNFRGKENERDRKDCRAEAVPLEDSVGDRILEDEVCVDPGDAGASSVAVARAGDELDDVGAPSVADLDKLDLNEFYLGGAPTALQGMANGLQILDSVVTGYAIAQEFAFTGADADEGRNDDRFYGTSSATVSIDGTYCTDTNGHCSSPDPERDGKSFARPVNPSGETAVDELQSDCISVMC